MVYGTTPKNRKLIDTIADQHDVSKHRSAIFEGGRVRNDPPPGFFEKLGMEEDRVRQSFVSPGVEIILRSQPKTPWRQRQPKEYKDIDKLEDIAERFCTFINMCGVKALEDAKSNLSSINMNSNDDACFKCLIHYIFVALHLLKSLITKSKNLYKTNVTKET